MNARLIVLFASDRQYALARLLRHAQLFTTTVEYQAGGRFGDARQFGDIFDSYAFGFHQHPGALKQNAYSTMHGRSSQRQNATGVAPLKMSCPG